MSQPSDAPGEPSAGSRLHTDPRAFVRRIWRAILAHKGLVAVILLTGALNALCTKGAYVLFKPVIDALTQDEGAVAPVAGVDLPLRDRLTPWMSQLGTGVRDLLGLQDAFGGDARFAAVLGCAAVALLLAVFGAATLYFTSVFTRYFGVKLVVELRNEVAAHILRLPLRFFGLRRMGDLLSNVTTDTAVLIRAFSLALDNAVLDPLMVLMNFTILVVLVPELSWILVVLVPITAIPLVRMGRKVHKRSSRSLAAMGDATESLNQMLGGIRTVKAFQLEQQRLAEFAASNARFLDRQLSVFKARGLSQGLTFLSYQTAFALMLVGLGWMVLGGHFSAGDLALLVAPLTTSYTHVKRLARAYNTLMESVGAYEGIAAVLAQRPDVDLTEGRPLPEVRGAVEFRGVSFAYGAEPVLREVSFRVAPGQMVALVGPSGAGKSTALDLLARFHDPQSGQILIDGHDLRDVRLSDYRRRLAIVSQQPFLFNTTIAENIRLGRPDASHDEVVAAARAAHIDDFIATLPRGYDTLCGERGANLSGGQMQRITIARAVLRDPALLILDEATSALDSESEKAVQEALAELMRGRTSFVIAHRLSTVRDADLILVLDQGRVVQQGGHRELIDRAGLYARLTQLQQA